MNNAIPREVNLICDLLRKKDHVQVDGYEQGDGGYYDPSPRKFGDRFDDTLTKVKDILAAEGIAIKGYYSPGGPWVQPYECWMFYRDTFNES